MMEQQLPLILASILALVHFLGEELDEYIGGHHERIVSFAAGISITYIFTMLLPEYQRIVSSSDLMFLTPLIGFSSFHLLEKFIAKRDFERSKLRREYSELHSGFLMVYHGAIGYLLASLITKDSFSGIIFFLPILFHSAVSSLSFSELEETVAHRTGVKLTVALAPVAGVVLYGTGLVSSSLFNPVFGLVTGMFIYIVIRDSIPKEDDGKPVEYLLGLVSYLFIIIGSKLFF